MIPELAYTGICLNSSPTVHAFSFSGARLFISETNDSSILPDNLWLLPSLAFTGALLLVYFILQKVRWHDLVITRRLLQPFFKRARKKTDYVVFKERGKHIRIHTHDICFVKASGNYIEIQTDTRKYVTRHKIGGFLDLVPEPLEFLRISRSSIVRLDKIQEKSRKEVTVRGEKITVGETYLGEFRKIKF